MVSCPFCKRNTGVIKSGLRQTQKGVVQRYFCKTCNAYFTDTVQPYTQYPLHVILFAIEQYNRGYPVSEVKRRTGKRYRFSPPIQTIYSWLERYKDTCTFIKTRKHYEVDPSSLLNVKKLYHQQVYPFTYHTLKLNLSSKQFPQLRRYIQWVERCLPDTMFQSGPRASSFKIPHNTDTKEIDNIIPEMSRLALSNCKKNSDAHDVIEQFFLIHDATTVCTELPVFLNPAETDLVPLTDPLTGHIDIIQIRYNTLYILDYKPNLKNPNRYASQLRLYKEAVAKRTSIPDNKIVTGVFNSHGYFEFNS